MGIIFDKPLIGVVMCQTHHQGHPVQSVHNKYLDAVVIAGGIPLALPHQLTAAPHLAENAMAALDGILLTGSPSHLEPWLYGEDGDEPDADPGRDRLAFDLITHAVGKQLPLFGICRGMQELVVANGGALYRHLNHHPQFQRHHEEEDASLEQTYAPAHSVQITPGGLLDALLRSAPVTVNSVHHQGVREVGPQVRIEARAPDGLIEAVSLPKHPFALAVQWHPEWQLKTATPSFALFDGFIQAALHYHLRKHA